MMENVLSYDCFYNIIIIIIINSRLDIAASCFWGGRLERVYLT